MKMYISEGRRFYLAAGAIFTFNLIFLIALVLPNNADVDALRNNYSSLRKDRASKIEELKVIADSGVALKTMNSDIDMFLNRMPEKVTMSGIVREFHRLAKKSALSISSAKYSPPVREGEYLMRNDISFPVSGLYKNIRKFIYNIEKMPYLMTIDDPALTSRGDQTVSVTIRISLYLRVEADE
ncbi:MAG: type 4a pilus biogenesis protein PilO [bacterium]|nr:type 4a pilus biogenesis protein PilO [bacterium]